MKNIGLSHCWCAIFFLGIVDLIEAGDAEVDLTNSHGKVTREFIPTVLFPCKIKEGDMFYIAKIDGVTEIRCGEPPD